MATVTRPTSQTYSVGLTTEEAEIMDVVETGNPTFLKELIDQALGKKRLRNVLVSRETVGRKYENLTRAQQGRVEDIFNE